ncbi:MAG: CDP-glucose 4,6-dehydratase [Oscillospiraceae bacterium]|nr:CDP-glucose 4,6-dehydratase [Oscillospiraceae bacterium]
MENLALSNNFYNNKKVFVTGHTGFKGAWLCRILSELGAEVVGYALSPPTEPNLYSLLSFNDGTRSVIGDICDFPLLHKTYSEFLPDIVFHLAAQPIVRESYANPVYTYQTNVMGTVNLLECVRLGGKSHNARSVVNVTTDKVYINNEETRGYKENERLCGYDPYSNSKSCSELVTYSYNRAYFKSMEIAVSTARAGNVIGGGDFARDRLIPDCVRAALTKTSVKIRNRNSVRPYQHVIEPLFAYLLIAQEQYNDISFADSYNVGPDEKDCVTSEYLAEAFCRLWGDGMSFYAVDDVIDDLSDIKKEPHEASCLKLDCSKIKTRLGWSPLYDIDRALTKTVDWTKAFCENERDVDEVCIKQIREYIAAI